MGIEEPVHDQNQKKGHNISNKIAKFVKIFMSIEKTKSQWITYGS